MLEEKYSFNYNKPICLVLDEKDDHKCSDTLCGYVGQKTIFEYSKIKKIINLQNFFLIYTLKFKNQSNPIFQSKCTNFGYFIHIKRQNFSIFLEMALNPLTKN